MKRLVTLLLPLVAPAAPTLADTPEPAGVPLVLHTEAPAVIDPAAVIDPVAQDLLDRSAAAYLDLTKFSTHFESNVHNGDKVTSYVGDVSFSRADNKGRMDYTANGARTILVADGQKYWQQSPGIPVTYWVGDTRPGQAQGIVTSRLNFVMNFPVFEMMIGQGLMRSGYAWETVKSMPGNGIELTGNNGEAHYVMDVAFDPFNNLIRKIEVINVFKGQTLKTAATFSAVEAEPDFAPDAFTYSPPAGAKLAVPPQAIDPKLVVGARPFELVGQDLEGKNHVWSEFKGKVVLLDFWATWCGPCMGELPNVLKNYGAYHGNGFEIVGVSLDDNKNDLIQMVGLKGLSYPNILDGKGWKNANAVAYGVHSIPFSLLIGKDGRIAAVNPRGPLLEPAIKKALAKP